MKEKAAQISNKAKQFVSRARHKLDKRTAVKKYEAMEDGELLDANNPAPSATTLVLSDVTTQMSFVLTTSVVVAYNDNARTASSAPQ
jgi:hypothetical protein